MTNKQYAAALKKLGLTTREGGALFGFERRQSQRLAGVGGEPAPIPHLVARVVQLLLDGKITQEDLR